MTPLNKRATRTFLRLVDGLHDLGDSKTVDNANGAFMSVHVELIARPQMDGSVRENVFIVSVAHYYEQNGDLVADPDVTFLLTAERQVYPLTFEQGGLVHQVTARFSGGQLQFNQKAQKDLASFCNQWMRNIAEQQGIE